MHTIPIAVLAAALFVVAPPSFPSSPLSSTPSSSPAAPRPSDPSGVFAVLDTVELLPTAEQPTRIVLHGAFAVAEGARGAYYRAPRRGVLHFGLGKDVEATRAQWRDLQKLAGTGTAVSFGSRYEANGPNGAVPQVVGEQDAVAEPPVYATGWGVQTTDNVRYGPVRELMLLPRCHGVDLGGERRPEQMPERQVVFTATNCMAADDGLRYVFTATTSDGDRVASGLVVPGKGLTTWTVPMALQVGETITWTVQVAADGIERAPVDAGTFVVPANAVETKR